LRSSKIFGKGGAFRAKKYRRTKVAGSDVGMLHLLCLVALAGAI